MRIVSLLPSLTELVCALGHRESLVGVTHECDFPPGVERLPHLTRSRIPASASSAEIDAVGRLAGGVALRPRRRSPREPEARPDPHAEPVRRLRGERGDRPPMCGGPARLAARRERQPDRLARRGGHVRARGRGPRATDPGGVRIAQAVEDEAAEIGRASPGSARRSGGPAGMVRPAVSSPVTGSPTSSRWPADATSWADRASRRDGRTGTRSPPPIRRSSSSARAGSRSNAPRRNCPPRSRVPNGAALRAVREGRVVLIDGSAYFSRPGPRLLESLRIAAAAIDPAAFEENAPG